MANVTFFGRVSAGVTAARKAFREAYTVGKHIDPDDWTDYDARKLRYSILWAFFENTAYREIHTWASLFKSTFGVYRYARNIYNPAYRLGTFWQTHLWGGLLDKDAGDGDVKPSALPIITDNERLREPIAQLWQWSNWQTRKDLPTLFGATMGDTAIRVVDDPARGKVYLETVHPATLREVALDPFGNVKGYVIEQERKDPRNPTRDATYTEVVTRDESGAVVYATYKDGRPFAWVGDEPEWREDYGFVPLVFIQHNDVGLEWGWAEMQPAMSKIRESDDLAAMLSDQIRKTVNVPWLFTGVKKTTSLTLTATEDTTTGSAARPEAGREDIPAVYGDKDAKAQALIANLPIDQVANYISTIIGDLEADYPELAFEKLRLAGSVTGETIRKARQPAEAKVIARRAAYDDALVRAQQMAVAIGGQRNYDGFAGFNLGSYDAGALDHEIGPRAVFQVDTFDAIAEKQAFWSMAETAGKAGAVLPAVLEREGWTPEEIATITESPEYTAKLRAQEMAALGFGMMAEQSDGDEDQQKEEGGDGVI